jgi:methionine synthase II (cobalamin-independent)
LVELYRDNAPDSTLLPRLRSAIADVVREQARSGVDVVNDGEFGKAMRRAVDFGAWWSYVYDRLAGFELREAEAKKGRAAWTGGRVHPQIAWAKLSALFEGAKLASEELWR